MFRLILCVLLGLATFKLALAEPSQEENTVITQLPLMIQCLPSEIVERMVEEYEELPFIEGNGSWQIPDGQSLSGRIEMYANPDTGTFTLVIAMGEAIKCVVISGHDLRPWLSEENAT